MTVQLYHQRYQNWNREPEVTDGNRLGSGLDPAVDMDARAAYAGEFKHARLGRLGERLLTEIEHYLAFFTTCNEDIRR
jgi:hypothetical protein